MARNAISLLTAGTPWASTDEGARNREAIPGDLRRDGWDEQYSQTGGKLGPERVYVNQLLHEMTILMELVNRSWLLPWSELVDYEHPAFVMGSDGSIWRTLENTGPATGNITDPTRDGQTVWRIY